MGSMRSMTETSETSQAFDDMLHWIGELRHQRGHGNWAQLDRRLGHSEGYLGRVLRQEIRLTTDMLLRILDVLDVEPGLFFQHVFRPSGDPAEILALLRRQMSGLRRADGSPEPELDMATLAWLQDLRAAKQRLTRHCDLPSVESAGIAAKAALVQQLEDIKGCLDIGSDEATEALSDWLTRVSRQVSADPHGMCDLLAMGLAIQGQIFLMGETPRKVLPTAACRHLEVAWDLAQGVEARAEVLLNAAQLAIRAGAVGSAQLLVPQAVEAAALVQRPSVLGRALLLKGRLCELRRDWRQGSEAFGAALSFFGGAPGYLRCKSFLGGVRCALETGDLDTAGQILQQAEGCQPRDGHPQNRKTVYEWRRLQGAWAEACGRWDDALVQYRAALQVSEESRHFADAVLMTLREARLLLAMGRTRDVQRLTAQSMGWTRPLRRQRRMCEVVTEMARLALTDELHPQWLLAAEKELEPLADLHGLSGVGLG